MKQYAILIIAGTLIMAGCRKTPDACFKAPDQALENEPVEFENCSVDAHSYYWWFDDNDTSYAVNPVKSFAERGLHLVYLTAYDKSGNKQSKSNEQIRIGNLYVDSLVVTNLEMTDATGANWDNDGTGPDVRLIYGETDGKVKLTSKEFSDFALADLPMVVKPQSTVKLTDTLWSFILVDQDAATADTMATWQVDPVQYDHEGPYFMDQGRFKLELHYFFE